MYELFKPPEHLSNVVRYYWLLDLSSKNKNLTEFIFAYPYVNWVFTLGTPYSIKANNFSKLVIKDTRILGPRTDFAEYLHPEGNLAFGVTFQFGSTRPIFREETNVLTNKIILQDDILPSFNWLTPFFNEVKLSDFIPSLSKQIEKLSGEDLGSNHALWKRFIELILVKKNYSTSAQVLSSELRVSQRHLQRITMHYAGFTPKQIQSMLRCRLAIRHINETGFTPDFFHYGYYDQNHFIREVRRWTGFTPKVLLGKLG